MISGSGVLNRHRTIRLIIPITAVAISVIEFCARITEAPAIAPDAAAVAPFTKPFKEGWFR